MATIKRVKLKGRIHDIGADSTNVSYGTSTVKDALDSADERLTAVENSSSSIVGGSPLTDNDNVAFNLKRVYEKSNFAAASGWEIRCESYVADQNIDFVYNTPFTLVVEVQAGDTSLGDDAITNISISLNYRSHLSGYSWVHKWDGTKDIYTITAPNARDVSNTNVAFGVFGFAIHGADGKNVKVASYFTHQGVKFYCKKCYYSATSSTSAMDALDYRIEWPEVATTVDKIDALIDNHQLPFCSAGSEYDQFMAVNTTPRVIVTIVSDDGEVHDYTRLHPYLQSMAEQYGVDIRWSIALPSNFVTYKESIRNGDPSVNGDRMTASMIRDLVGNYGVSVLCHNYNHEYIAHNNISLTPAEVEHIVTNARRQLERKVGVPCIHHCLPGGGYNSGCWAEIAKQFISTATTTDGINTPDSDSFRIYRVRFDRASGESASELSPSRLQFILDAQTYVANNNKSAWVVYYTHGQEWGLHAVNIKGITEYCCENGIAMRNYSEAYAEMYPAINRLRTLLGIS